MDGSSSNPRRWWIFDLPPRVDPLLLLLAMVLGLGGMVRAVMDHDDSGSVAVFVNLLLDIPISFILVGVIFGTPREYVRARRNRGSDSGFG